MHLQNTQKEALGVTVSAVSNYYHGHKGHGATAIGKYRSFSGYTRAGVKAKASATKHNCWINRAYYNIY